MKQKIGERQRWVWLASGLTGVTAACTCGLNWVWVLVAAILVSLYNINMEKRLPRKGVAELLPECFGIAGKILAVPVLLWSVLLMAWSANLVNRAFPMADGEPILGWTVLALAAWGGRKGSAACAGCAGVLCMFLLALYGVIAGFAIPDIRLNNLIPAGGWEDGVAALGIFLLPAAVWYLPGSGSRGKPMWQMVLILPLFAGGLAVVTSGVLSPLLARSQPAALYTLAKSVSLFGVVERIEPLLSVAVTMGIFCLLSALNCACVQLWAQLRPWHWSGIICSAAAAVMMELAGKMSFWVVTAGTVAAYALLPLVIAIKRPTNSGKTEV